MNTITDDKITNRITELKDHIGIKTVSDFENQDELILKLARYIKADKHRRSSDKKTPLEQLNFDFTFGILMLVAGREKDCREHFTKVMEKLNILLKEEKIL